MPELKWDQIGERFYETGVSKGVLYVQDDSGKYPEGVAWSGLSSVAENPSGAEETKIYADNMKYLSLYSAEDFAATVECYTTPDEFAACDGQAQIAKGVMARQQDRKAFGMSYQTILGNDTKHDGYGYKIHIIYGAVAKPSSKTHSSINESPEAATMSYELSTTPVDVADLKPTAYIEISSKAVTPEALKKITDALYGTSETKAYLPTPDEIKALIEAAA